MQFIVADRSVKVLAAAIAFLAKIGREIVFEGTADGVVLRTLNDARSSFATVVLKRGERLSAQGLLCQARDTKLSTSRDCCSHRHLVPGGSPLQIFSRASASLRVFRTNAAFFLRCVQ